MRKLIKRYQAGGTASSSGANTRNIGGSSFLNSSASKFFGTSLNLGGGSNFFTSSYSNPYQYRGLSTSFQNNAAQSNIENATGNFFGNKGDSSGSSSGSFFGSNGWGMVGNISGALSSIMPTKKTDKMQAMDSTFDAASDTVMMVNPMVGGIMKAGGLVSDTLNATGVTQTDGLTTWDEIAGSKLTSLLPPMLINNIFHSTLDKVKNDQITTDTLARTGGGYGGFMDDWEKAQKYSGKKLGLFNSKSKYNGIIHEANRQMSLLSRIMSKKADDDLLTAQMGDRWNERTMRNLNGGYGNISFGRLGLKIEILDKVHSILNAPKVLDTLTELEDEVSEFKEGGKMNVIPEGSLHARLHHMENAEGLTKKGIPVVSEKEGGELEQQAEIELNEIIFTLEVTQTLEKLMEDGSDNAAIEAGKLLVKEIFENTNDRTGLLKQLEPEKKVQTPEEIVAQHQAFQQGGVINSDKSIEQLVDYAIQVNPLFVQRIGPNMGYAEFDDEKGQRRKGTHLLGYTEKDNKYLVFPQIQMKEGRLQYIPDWKEAFDTASKQNNVISFDNEKDALTFTEKYKDSKQWKQYFDIWKQRYD